MKYLLIYEDGSLGQTEQALTNEDYQQVEDGMLYIIKFDGTFQRLIVESTTQDEPEEEDGLETEPEVEWTTDWEPV